MQASPFILTEADKQWLLDLAETQIRNRLAGKQQANLLSPDAGSRLAQTGCCFVSLHLNGRLRGCIGSVEPHQSLSDDVREHAIDAAFNDPRFAPLTESELDGLNLEISVLTPGPVVEAGSRQQLCQQLQDRPGLILRQGGRRAVFLPQAWKLLPEPEQFIEQLLQKGGWPSGYWPTEMVAKLFTVISFERRL